jgi:hypothetical protein
MENRDMKAHRTQVQWHRQWKRRGTLLAALLAAMASAWVIRDAGLSTRLLALQPPPGAKPSGFPQSALPETDLATPPETTTPINSPLSSPPQSTDSRLVAPPGLDLTPQPTNPDDPTLATIRDLLLERSQQAAGGIESILKGARLLEAEAIASGQMEIPGSLGHEQATAARELRQQARRLILLTP